MPISDYNEVFDNPTEPRSAAAEGADPMAIAFRPPGIPAAGQVPAPYEPDGDSPKLSGVERRDLATCEAAVDTLRTAFWAAGKALQTIRGARLYRETHGAFEEYCQDRWEMSRRQVDRLIAAWPLAERLRPIGLTNEGQVRELLPVAERHGQDAAVTVYRAIAEADGVRVTAAVIKGAVAVLPGDGGFDAGEAVVQIRAYLAGELAPVPAAGPAPVEQVARFRASLRRIKVDAVRAAGPQAARELAAELHALAERLELEEEGEGGG